MPFDLAKNPTPINKTASLVVYGNRDFEDEIPKEDWIIKQQADNKGFKVSSHSLLPLDKTSVPIHIKNNPEFIDFTGKRFGKLTVCGKLDKKQAFFVTKGSSADSCKWVVRCECGKYELRVTRTVKRKLKDANNSDSCEECSKKEWESLKPDDQK